MIKRPFGFITIDTSAKDTNKSFHYFNKTLFNNRYEEQQRLKANNDNIGEIKWLTEKDINEVLENDYIVKLVNRNARNYEFNAVNWCYSKGDTIDSVCVILIGIFDEIDKDTFDAVKDCYIK